MEPVDVCYVYGRVHTLYLASCCLPLTSSSKWTLGPGTWTASIAESTFKSVQNNKTTTHVDKRYTPRYHSYPRITVERRSCSEKGLAFWTFFHIAKKSLNVSVNASAAIIEAVLFTSTPGLLQKVCVLLPCFVYIPPPRSNPIDDR